MSRTVFSSALLLALAAGPSFLQADEPAAGSPGKAGTNTYSGNTTISGGVLQLGDNVTTFSGTIQGSGATTPPPGQAINGAGTLTPTGSNTYSGSTTIVPPSAAPGGGATVSGGELQLAPAGPTATFTVNGAGQASNVTFTNPAPAAGYNIAMAAPSSAKVFYIITEGAGLGDSVRSVGCTGNETVLDAISMVNGISQISDSKKIWIARPGQNGKSATLAVNWEDISRRGINTTNYTLQPGDRLVLGEDALIKQSNMIAKKTAPLERLMGVTSLTTSVVNSLGAAPGGGEAVKDLVRKNYLSDDEAVKQLVLDLVRIQEEESKKAGGKPAAERKP
jgi:hypothetical protein